MDSTFNVARQSEDCLTLNVWTPAATGARLPVLFWIHGGAFEWGASYLDVYHGDRLAAGGAVVVSLNYRLGPLGALWHPELTDREANFGLLDQVAALEWVQQNIAAFGGDPGRVTLIGQSAGASYVLFLMASERARGLFHAAVAISPTGLQGFRSTQGSAAAIAESLAQACGAGSVGDLRSVPADAVIAAQDQVKAKHGFFLWQPLIDGVSLTEPPAQVFAAGRQAPVPLLIGDTDWEGSEFGVFADDAAIGAFLQVSADAVGAMRADDPASHRAAPGDFAGQALISASTDYIARAHARAGHEVWRFRLTHQFADFGRAAGCGHGDDLPLLFGKFGVNGYPAATPRDRAMSRVVQGHVLNFARSRAPKGAWPPFAATSDNVRIWDDGGEREGSLAAERLCWLSCRMQQAALNEPNPVQAPVAG